MMIAKRFFWFLTLGLTSIASLANSSQEQASVQPSVKIAFMPDIHFHDVKGKFSDNAFTGVTDASGEAFVIRTMQSQLNSTRLFNENYYALIAALDDAVAEGIRHIVLPGDFSDDGQPIHMRGLAKILNDYQTKYDLQFLATTGNHDPVRPFDSPGGEPDFLSQDGSAQPIFSIDSEVCEKSTSSTPRKQKIICSDEVKHLGYHAILKHLDFAGFYPKPDYHYWATPYSSDAPYSFDKAQKESALSQRGYEICEQGTGGAFKKQGYSHCHWVPDATYVVETIPNIWLLAIDANVYIPTGDNQFQGSGNSGYNKMMSHKTHVIHWIEKVVAQAAAQGKTLIAFSHFPMTEFHNGQSEAIADLFGETSFQLVRKPEQHVSQSLADTGLKLHIGGHMHFNDAGWVTGKMGDRLLNVQAPSLAAFVPAYTVVTIDQSQKAAIETRVVKDVTGFKSLFAFYEKEHAWLKKNKPTELWNHEILNSKDYQEFTEFHLRALVSGRFMNRDWPEPIREFWKTASGYDLLVASFLEFETIEKANLSRDSRDWKRADTRVNQLLKEESISFEALNNWTAFELAVDFYKVTNTGDLAIDNITPDRWRNYETIKRLTNSKINPFSKFLNNFLTILIAMRDNSLDSVIHVDLSNPA